MTKVYYLLVLSILFAFLSSCETDNTEFDTKQSEEVFVIGELKNSTTKNSRKGENQNINRRGLLTECATSGPLCGLPNQTISYTLTTPDVITTINWIVDSSEDISIASGQGTNTVTLNLGSDFEGGQISVEFDSSICVSPLIRNIPLCGGPGPDDCTTYSLGILDEYIDGTQSGADIVYLHAGGNFPSGTTYAWTIKRQNGSTQFYSASTSNPRQVVASINNRITQATVTAEYEDCIKTVTKTFMCAIPNADINGNLFTECNGQGNNGGFGRVK